MVISALFMNLNNAILKLLTEGLPPGEIMFLRAAARLERFARALERLGGRGVRENASKPSAIVETARRRVARRFGALM